MEKILIRDPEWKKVGSGIRGGINIPELQHWFWTVIILEVQFLSFLGVLFCWQVRGMCDNYASFDVQMVAQYQE
jgi:hypothetical protein